MKRIFLLTITFLSAQITFAQTPRVSLEHNGTSTIYTTLQAAYNAAVDDDVLILSGGTFTIQDSIKKRLTFIGAGISPDSTQTTQASRIRQASSTGYAIRIYPSGSGSIFDGIQFIMGANLISVVGQTNDVDYSLRNCNLSTLQHGTGCLIKNCVVTSYVSYLNSSTIRNTICQFMSNCTDCIVENILTSYYGSHSCTTSVFRNSIFNIGAQPPPGYNSNELSPSCNYYNCIRISSSPYHPYNTNEFNTIVVANLSSLFNSSVTALDGSLTQNYHLIPNSPGSNAGTDGTDIGIYGGSEPCPDGWVPSNPHIMSKTVSTSNTSDGKLNVNFKVRKGN